MKETAKTILNNSVGKITTETVKVKTEKEGFKTIPIEDIVAVKSQLKRKYVYAVICYVFGLAALFVTIMDGKPTIGGFLIPVVLIVAGIANMLGYYTLEIHTQTAIVKLEDVEFNKLKDGRAFIEKLEKLIATQNQTSA